ncbi:hypothetical protein KL920_003561 [Ogataea angusta]|uniref:Zn(2)-C6 fungal-type domain-containing protein n=1 Tax=Pichia angusta TaxID=870730 RepID=A0AAN6I517_PICAN|nr:uncharacterized protein KL928_004336 [Ogataea angusta]KAG7816872.1 hypothetical protein KL928_004336 [Ogataea angusta]KAG7828424.1 hypothetical protein KL920_003561 [Ogataea angusta]
MSSTNEKAKRHKSRNGCITCKKKRLKCGEEKPACANCIRRKIVCGGYQTRFKWKGFTQTAPFETSTRASRKSSESSEELPDTKSADEPAPGPEQDAAAARQLPSEVIQKALEAATLSVTGKSAQEIAIANALMASGRNPDLASSIASTLTDLAARTPSVHSAATPEKREDEPAIKQEDESVLPHAPLGGNSPLLAESPAFSDTGLSLSLYNDCLPRESRFVPGNVLYDLLNSVTTPEGRLDSPKLLAQLEKNPAAMEEYQQLAASPTYSSVFRTGNSPLAPMSPLASLDDERTPASPVFCNIVSAFTCLDRSDPSSPETRPALAPHHILTTSSPSSIPRAIEIKDKTFKILGAYETYTSAIMSIKNGPSENPWRTLFLPMTQEYPVVCNAVSAMACFHLARGDQQLRSQGMTHMKNAIVELVHGLSDKTIPPDVALAACLALAMSEAWDRHVTTGIGHLRGARTMITRLLGAQQAPEQSDLRFLFNTWMYFDVLARMTASGDGDDDDDGGETPGKQRATDFNALVARFEASHAHSAQDIDPLLGVMQKLFPVIGNVASLVQRVRKESRSSLSIITQAVQLKQELERWRPPALRNYQVEDPLFDLASTVATAEAYRYSTLLYLHQAVPEVPSKSSHNLAKKVLMLLASIPTSSRTCVTHIFPLLVASCEAEPGEEREWVKARWELLSSKMWLGSIDRALEVVKEVWTRKDIVRRKRAQAQQSRSDGADDDDDDDSFASLSRKISEAVHGGDGPPDDDDERVGSWSHWSTVMKEWDWEVLLA